MTACTYARPATSRDLIVAVARWLADVQDPPVIFDRWDAQDMADLNEFHDGLVEAIMDDLRAQPAEPAMLAMHPQTQPPHREWALATLKESRQ